MDSPVATALEHYELCIDEGVDPFHDDEMMHSYMARWDGPLFIDLLTRRGSGYFLTVRLRGRPQRQGLRTRKVQKVA